MVGLYPHCVFGLNGRAPSIDTPLHGLVDQACIDHMHPDAVIAIAASADSEALTREIWGGEIGWLPWVRPGFELGVRLQAFAAPDPRAKGVVLEAHGLFTWGDSDRAGLRDDPRRDQPARSPGWRPGRRPRARSAPSRRLPCRRPSASALAAALMPRLRGLVCGGGPQGRPFRRQRRGAGVRGLGAARTAGRARHLLPRPLPAHQDLAAGPAVRRRPRKTPPT